MCRTATGRATSSGRLPVLTRGFCGLKPIATQSSLHLTCPPSPGFGTAFCPTAAIGRQFPKSVDQTADIGVDFGPARREIVRSGLEVIAPKPWTPDWAKPESVSNHRLATRVRQVIWIKPHRLVCTHSAPDLVVLAHGLRFRVGIHENVALGLNITCPVHCSLPSWPEV